MNTSPSRTYFLVTTALFSSILCVSAYISIPLPNGSHITLVNFVALLVALLFSAKQACLIITVWLLLGAVGMPVFIGGNAGISYLAGGWGGYSFAFAAIAILIPLLRGKQYQRIQYTILSIMGAFLIDVLGAAWLMAITGISARQAILIGILPFLPLDLFKAVVAAQIVPQFQRILTQAKPG